MKNTMIYGLHAIEARLQKKEPGITKLYLQKNRRDKRAQKIIDLAQKKHVTIESVDLKTIETFVGDARHQGVVAEIKAQENLNENDLYSLLESLDVPPFLLILDGVQDPHNLGACLRTADAAGVHAVIVPKDNAVGITPSVSKVASGAAETVPFFQVTNLSRTMRDLKEQGIWMIGSAGEATDSLFQAKLTGPTEIVMGAEGSGRRRLTKENCDQLLHIPMQGSVASLNVSVATGIFLFAYVSQLKH